MKGGIFTNIYDKMNEIAKKLDNLQNYDTIGFVRQLEYLISQLDYFYSFLVKKQGNESLTFYKPKKRPDVGQIAYFNLTRGFPKELYDGHFCYIVKDFKSKFLIVPTTSIKEDSEECNPDFEFDIEDNTPNGKSRLHIDEIRVVDIQRLNITKGFYDVVTDKGIILEAIKNKLG